VEIFQFDRREKNVRTYGSEGFRATRVAAGEGRVRVTCLRVEPGGLIGTHPAADTQLFLVLDGEGWVAGPDGERTPITGGWGVCWDAGEIHTSGTQTGFVALDITGGPLVLFEPETPDT
jgi:quercetin dioxygenase-like cupin family protein